MSMKELERRVNLLVDYVCSEDPVAKEHILIDLQNLKSEVSVGNSVKIVTEDLLIELGVPANLSGFKYITEAVCLMIDHPNAKRVIHKEIYPKICNKYATTVSRVERSIRHSIEVWITRCDSEVLVKYFGNTISSTRGKVTNTEFLFRVTQLVRREVEGA